MINNLRKKLAATNMIATSIVLIVAAIIISFTGVTRLDTIRQDNMERALEYPLNQASQENFSHNFSDVVLVVYNNGNVEQLYSGENVSNDFVQQIFERLPLIVHSQVEFDDKSFRVQYIKQPLGNGAYKIVFFDPTNYQSGIIPLIYYTIAVLVVGMVTCSIISITLAQSAIIPIEESWTKQRQFVADASHELKTPLSVIMANTEIIASHPDETVASQQKWIDNTLAETRRMASLVQDLLFLAKSDDGLKVEMTPTNLSDCVESCVLTSEALFYENKLFFTNKVEPNVQVEGNEGQLKQLVAILLDNANKYAIGEGNITLTLATTNRHAVLTVANDSNEVSPEQVAHIFDRFYTLDTSRNKSKGGNGLGLSIAERIVQTHKGKISAEYKNGRMTFKAVLPLLRKHK
ncbi:MAG: HAMP domain-containing histidine kinase [Clostridia bacterium]|nr:HAMP domain-containing histidine kinase [Clostridia bacterium]